MALTYQNTIFVYRDGDATSELIADKYCALRGLDVGTAISVNAPTGQKVPINCSSSEILSDEATFNTQVLTPILNAITDIENYGINVWCIVLGFNVPGGFYDGSDVISSTSRISRIKHPLSKKLINNLYDRKQFKRFDATDAEFALVVSRIDGPNGDVASSLISKAEIVKQQLFTSGTFYMDPYSDKQGDLADKYTTSLLDFQSRILPQLNLDTWSTSFVDPYIDQVIPSVRDESYIWSWFTDRGSMSFFRQTNAIRLFAYNADDDGAFSVRSLTDRRWPVLSMRSGYAGTAGSMSAPGYDAFLNPNPFFSTLLKTGTFGEALLFSQPYLDWTISVFGDPLMSVSFPNQPEIEAVELVTEDESWRMMIRDLSRAISHYLYKNDLLSANVDTLVASGDVSTAVDLLNKAYALFNANSDDRRRVQMSPIVEKLFDHIRARLSKRYFNTPNPDLDAYFYDQGYKISELVFDAQNDDDALADSSISQEGSWDLEFVVYDDANQFAFYHFELQVSDTPDFSNIIISKSSLSSLTNWSWEKNDNEFESLGAGGVPSNYIGRRVRYKSLANEALVRARPYYFRVRQRDENTVFDYRTYTDIIFS